VGVLLWTVLACGCAGSSEALEAEPEHGSRGGTLRMIQEAPRSLDPLACNSVYEALPVNQIFDTLVAYDPSLNVIPALAETWTISKDNREFIFVLREGVSFHDGSPLTAEDVVFSICRQLCPDTGEESLAQSYLMVIEGAVDFAEGLTEDVSGIQVIDSRKLKIRLARPYPSFLEVLAMDNLAIVPETLVREIGSEAFGRSPIGTGPFRLAEWSDDLLRMDANEEYFRGKPYLDEVRIRFLKQTDSDFGAARFTQGELDVIEPPTESLAALTDDRSVDLHRYQELSLSFLGLNTNRPPLNQKWLRQAIAHALDRGAMVADSPTVRREAVGVLPPGIAGYSPDPKTLRYDPEESRRLLAENGHPGGEGLAPVVLHNASRGSSALKLMSKLREDLGAVGIRLEVVPVSWAELGDHLDNQTAGAFLLAWIADLTDPDSFMRSLFESGGSGNYFGHRSDETDRLLAKGTQEFNPVERARIYRELERQVLEEAPMVPLYHTMGIVAVQADVKGLSPTPLGLAKVDLENVWFQVSRPGS
jgi:peptide/nickel transport system substrate-binding protein/oligopeptide transport system substrate-binding protein